MIIITICAFHIFVLIVHKGFRIYLPNVGVYCKFSSIMLAKYFAGKMLEFARKFFQNLCSRSLGDKTYFFHFAVNYKELLFNSIKANNYAMVKELLKNDSARVNQHITDNYK